MRVRAPIILTVVLLSISASAARADTWCVNTAGCDATHDKGNDLAAALSAAEGNAGVDTVKVGTGVYPTTTGFTYNSPDPVHIEGSGGRYVGPGNGPTLTNGANNLSGVTMLTVKGGSGSTISGVDVELPGGNGTVNSGIDTTGAIDNVLVQTQAGQPPSDFATGVKLRAGAALTHSDVSLELGLTSTGIQVAGPSTTVTDARIRANTGILSNTGGNSAGVRQARIDFGGFGIELNAGDATVDDSLLVGHPEAGNPIALSVIISSGSSSLTANHATLIGPATASSVALDVVNGGSGSASLAFRNGVISGFENRMQRVASGSGPADISTLYSNYVSGTGADSGPGAITQVNPISGPPGFAGTTDYHLRPDSVLIDSADPAETSGGGSNADLDGQSRLVDGNGDCTANRDIGAYEFQPGPRAPRTNASAAPGAAFTGQLVTFNSPDACDPDGDPLSYSWTFDDGGGAPGASVQRTFSTPGIHFGTVTVSDGTGRSATATASVFIAYPPFAGVAIGHGKVRASRRGAVKLNVSCPATTVGRCAGTLTLDGARTSFSMPAGASKPVTVKLSKSKLKALRKRKRQTFTAVAVAHDANGTAHTSSASLTLLAPR